VLKFASAFEKFADEVIDKKPSAQDVRDFFEAVTPRLVYDFIYSCKSLKQCGYLSDKFAQQARMNGFDARVTGSGNHFYNIVRSSDGPVLVDLTYGQFKMQEWLKDIEDAEDEKEEMRYIMSLVAENPAIITRFKLLEEEPQHTWEPEEPLFDVEKMNMMDNPDTRYIEDMSPEYNLNPDFSVLDDDLY